MNDISKNQALPQREQCVCLFCVGKNHINKSVLGGVESY